MCLLVAALALVIALFAGALIAPHAGLRIDPCLLETGGWKTGGWKTEDWKTGDLETEDWKTGKWRIVDPGCADTQTATPLRADHPGDRFHAAAQAGGA